MLEAPKIGHQLVEGGFARVAERRMTDIVSQGDGFGQVFVQPKDSGNGAPDARHLHAMGQPGAIVISLMIEEDLRLVFQAAERAAVHNSVPVPLINGSEVVLPFGIAASPRLAAFLGVGCQVFPLKFLVFFPRSHGLVAGCLCSLSRCMREVAFHFRPRHDSGSLIVVWLSPQARARLAGRRLILSDWKESANGDVGEAGTMAWEGYGWRTGKRAMKYRVPKGDGECLFHPAWENTPELIERNHSLLESYDFQVAGVAFRALRESIRRKIAAQAGRSLSGKLRIVVGAHQPGFHGPGILYKHTVLKRFSRHHLSVNFVVDSDVCKDILVNIPHFRGGKVGLKVMVKAACSAERDDGPSLQKN